MWVSEWVSEWVYVCLLLHVFFSVILYNAQRLPCSYMWSWNALSVQVIQPDLVHYRIKLVREILSLDPLPESLNTTTTRPWMNLTVIVIDVGSLTCSGSPHWDVIQWHEAGSPVVLTPVLHRQRQQEVWEMMERENRQLIISLAWLERNIL